MNHEVILVEELWKLYRLGEISTGTLSRDLNRWWARIRGKEDPYKKLGQSDQITSKSSPDVVWALKDVNFSVPQGTVLGIIGRNGAGKSTLLKIISRITTPTEGSIKVKGRVASLLEVGTGFHPEMTGRENVFMNGTLLGMTRAEIKKKLDDIIDFSGVPLYIDTPVKRYSSGMQVRLAFAVAAFLEPEILIVDEVLAVGDAEFQKRAIGRMHEVSKGAGRTVLFVSHNMDSIRQLCQTGILLENGMIKTVGNINSVIEDYAKRDVNNDAFVDLQHTKNRTGTGAIQFEWVKVADMNGNPCNQFFIGDTMNISFGLSINSTEKRSAVAIQIKTLDGVPLVHMMNRDSLFEITHKLKRETYNVKIDDIRLFPATYSVTLACTNPTGHDIFDSIDDCLTFTIMGGGKLTSRNLPRAAGIFFLTPEWKQIYDAHR